MHPKGIKYSFAQLSLHSLSTKKRNTFQPWFTEQACRYTHLKLKHPLIQNIIHCSTGYYYGSHVVEPLLE